MACALASACSSEGDTAAPADGGQASDTATFDASWPDTGASDGQVGDALPDAPPDSPTDVASDAPPVPAGPATLTFTGILEGTTNVKLPSIVATDATVTLVATTGERATVWQKAPMDADFGPPEVLGTARGQPDYAATTVNVDPDGTLHVVWIDQVEPDGSIRYRRRNPGGAWGPESVVVDGPGFRPFADVAGTALGPVVVWDEDERIRFTRSADQGATWNAPLPTVDAPPGSLPDLAGQPDGTPVLVHAWEEIHVERWDGTAFTRETVPRVSPADFHADASVCVGPDGHVWVAARSTEPRVVVAERDPSGTWNVASPFEEKAFGRVSVLVDASGGGHLAWASPEGSPPGIRYSYRPPGGSWQSPVIAPVDHFHHGAWMAVSRTVPLRVHVATEDFDDTLGLRLRWTVFEVP